MDIKQYKRAFTHAGYFHADDVFSAAFIKMLNPDLKINRVLSLPNDANEETDLIFDIGAYDGFTKFDHHQKNKEYRPDTDIPYAAFGLLWREFGKDLGISDNVFTKIEQKLVIPIDLADNGITTNALSSVISTYNPFWDEEVNPDDQFNVAVALAYNILKRTIDRAISSENAQNAILEAYKHIDNHVLVLDTYLPISLDLFKSMPDVLFYVYPSNRGGFNISAVPEPTVYDEFAKRAYFPYEWLGNPDKSLGMTFCHPNNFLASADTKEHAINIANIAIDRHYSLHSA